MGVTMRASFRTPFAAFVLSAVALSPSYADDPVIPTYQVTLRDRWKAGDIATLSANEKRERSIVRFIGSKASENPDDLFREKRVVDQEVVVKCVEADAQGVPTKRVLWFASFLYVTTGEAGPEKDASLEKVFVEVNGVGTGRTVTILSPDVKVSPRAMRWLEAEHGKGELIDALCGALEPKAPTAAEVTWKAAGDGIAAAVGSDDAPIDVEKTSAEATLASVEGEKGVYQLVVGLATKGRLIGKSLVPWKSGGVRKLEIRTTRAFAGDAFDATGESEEEFEGATAEKDGETRVTVKAQAEWVWAKGGTMPEIPKSGDVKSGDVKSGDVKPGAAKPETPAPDTPAPEAPKPDAPKTDK